MIDERRRSRTAQRRVDDVPVGVFRRLHKHGCHAELMWRLEIARDIFEHRRSLRRDSGTLDEFHVRLALRLWNETAMHDVENIIDKLSDAQPIEHALRVIACAVGEHELAPRQGFQGQRQLRGSRNRRVIDVVHEFEECLGRDAMHRHQTAQCCAVLMEKPLLDALRLCPVDLEQRADKLCHPLIDLTEQPAGRRIERVIEIEHPCLDVIEAPAHAPVLEIRVPIPCGVKSSRSTQCGMRPSTITTPSTPPSTTLTQLSTFGIIPPVMVPSAMSLGTFSSVSSSISRFWPSSTPATSVSSRSRLAFMAMAMAPAAVSAFTLYVSPSLPRPIGATTGMASLWMIVLSKPGLTECGSPTKPKSSVRISPVAPSTFVRLIRSAIKSFPSLPEIPTA